MVDILGAADMAWILSVGWSLVLLVGLYRPKSHSSHNDADVYRNRFIFRVKRIEITSTRFGCIYCVHETESWVVFGVTSIRLPSILLVVRNSEWYKEDNARIMRHHWNSDRCATVRLNTNIRLCEIIHLN